ncbi:hypothetical protein [Streptomyces uncialis]|uniref:hypothetical protein n=1 Tax=Streptomyces uncialis TaxID=1048205 RepID=UPI002F92CF65|nr:hypothetical protein OG924_37010 [Streptomyces uncialis]
MEFFRLVIKPSEHDPSTVEAALRRAWNACAEVGCPKPNCRAKPWEYCRNKLGGVWVVTQFHKPRQDAANTLDITRPVGIGGLRWARPTNYSMEWASQRVPQI